MLAVLVKDEAPLTGKLPVIRTTTLARFGKVESVPETALLLTAQLVGQAATGLAATQVATTLVSPAGSMSTNVAPLASFGPLLSITS